MKDKVLINKILKKVKEHKKYKSISEKIVVEEIERYLRKNPRTKEINKQTISEIRAELHKNYASFQTRKKRRTEEYFKPLNTNKLLSLTISTKERINDYNGIYKKIFKITGKPRTILDLGGGFNIFSFPLMNLSSVNYYSYDINEEDIKLINKYISLIKNLKGKAEILDIRNLKKINKLPKSDIILLFKVLDLIDKQNHKTSEQLIKQLIKKTKFIVASFATKTLTRKQMNYPNRKWFELMLERNKLKFKSFKTNNEIFYIVEK